MDSDDNSLLRKYRSSGDDEALRAFYEKVKSPVFRVVNKRLHDTRESLEIVDEAFDKFSAEVTDPSFDLEKPSLPYLITIATRLVSEKARKASRYKNKIRELGEKLSGEINVARNGEQDADEDLQKAIQKLKASDQDILHLRYWDGKGFEEIGELHNAPENTIRSRHDRALKQLRTWLGDRQMGMKP